MQWHLTYLHARRPGHKQHRNNKSTYLYLKSSGNTSGIPQTFKNKIRYKSDPFGKDLNLSKHSFSSDTFKLLNEILNVVPTPKKCNKKQLDT